MKIFRRGSNANYGDSSIELESPNISWQKSDSCILIKQSHIKDFSTTAHHNYRISLSFQEINMLIKSLSEAALLNPKLFEKELESSLKALVQIQNVTAGLKT